MRKPASGTAALRSAIKLDPALATRIPKSERP